MPDEQGSQYVKMRHACPKCQGVLEREIKTSKVSCVECKVEWPDMRAVMQDVVAARKSSPAEKVRGGLQKAKVAVRASRNVADGVRAISGIFGNIASAFAEMKEEGSDKQELTAKVGAEIEGIVDQAETTFEHVIEALSGKVTPEPPIKLEKETEEEA